VCERERERERERGREREREGGTEKERASERRAPHFCTVHSGVIHIYIVIVISFSAVPLILSLYPSPTSKKTSQDFSIITVYCHGKFIQGCLSREKEARGRRTSRKGEERGKAVEAEKGDNHRKGEKSQILCKNHRNVDKQK